MPNAAEKATETAIERARRERAALQAKIAPDQRRIRQLSRFISSGGAILAHERPLTLGEQLVAILRERGEPMRHSELLDALAAAKVPVCGKTRHERGIALQTALKRNRDVIERVDYGRYGLVEWSPASSRMRRSA